MTFWSACMADENKARILADGIEVWCTYDKLVKVEELIPHPKNPNTHPESQIKILAQNIRYHGWRHPIVVSKLSGYIVAGHGRLKAAQELGVSLIPVEYQNFSSEDNELAVLVGDNRLSELSSLDLNGLQDIVDRFKDDDFDTILAGYEPTDLESILGEKKPDFEDEGEKQLEQSEVTIQAGNYRFRMSQEDFGVWIDKLKQEVGFDKEAVIAELRRRLAI